MGGRAVPTRTCEVGAHADSVNADRNIKMSGRAMLRRYSLPPAKAL
jgi:hypothetical protein